MIGTKETLCTQCIHRDICSKKEEYLAAQSAVDATFVGTGDRSGIYLRDMKWIKPVQLQCIHYWNTAYNYITPREFLKDDPSDWITCTGTVTNPCDLEVRG